MDDDLLSNSGLSDKDPEQPKAFHNAVMAYIPFLCFLALFNKNSDEFTRQHGKQGLLLLLLEIVALLMLLPIGDFFWKVVLLACLGFSIAGIVYAFSGKPFTLPFIGYWADKF
ncbi:MAG: DUF4870 domain-containing protein [Fibrobacterota bacterium]